MQPTEAGQVGLAPLAVPDNPPEVARRDTSGRVRNLTYAKRLCGVSAIVIAVFGVALVPEARADGKTASAIEKLAEQHTRTGNHRQAAKAYRLAWQKHPIAIRYLALAGDAYLRAGDVPRAREQFEMVLSLAESHSTLGTEARAKLSQTRRSSAATGETVRHSRGIQPATPAQHTNRNSSRGRTGAGDRRRAVGPPRTRTVRIGRRLHRVPWDAPARPEVAGVGRIIVGWVACGVGAVAAGTGMAANNKTLVFGGGGASVVGLVLALSGHISRASGRDALRRWKAKWDLDYKRVHRR